MERRQRALHARLTIRRRGDVELGEMTQVRARGIPVQNLDKKQLDGRHRIEGTLAPPIGGVMTGRPVQSCRNCLMTWVRVAVIGALLSAAVSNSPLIQEIATEDKRQKRRHGYPQ